MHAIAEAAVEGFLTPFRLVRDFFMLKFLTREPVKMGFVDECEMHANAFGKIDDLRSALERLAAYSAEVVKYNRLYLSGESVMLNITIQREMYLFTIDEEGYEVSKRNKKTSQAEKHRVEYDHIKDGSFLELFKQ